MGESNIFVRTISDVLQPQGLSPPDLEFLRPNERQYTTLLMQPSGPIFASRQRIGPADCALAGAKGRKFLELAQSRNAHLAVTPEYFLPWSTLRDAIAGGITPAADALWVLGSESITQDGLEQFKRDVAGHCLVLHEPWEDLMQDRSLLDPVVLLFQATGPDQSTRLVALIQFKTYPPLETTRSSRKRCCVRAGRSTNSAANPATCQLRPSSARTHLRSNQW